MKRKPMNREFNMKIQQHRKSSSGEIRTTTSKIRTATKNPICCSAIRSDSMRETRGGRRCGVGVWVAPVGRWCRSVGGTGWWVVPPVGFGWDGWRGERRNIGLWLWENWVWEGGIAWEGGRVRVIEMRAS